MSASERRALAKVAVPGLALGVDVLPLEASQAIASCAPELVLCSWLPPGHRLLDTLIRAPVRYVLELGAGSGVTASAYSWRFAHEFLEGPLEQSARCRLDARPHKALHSRVTLYFGKYPRGAPRGAGATRRLAAPVQAAASAFRVISPVGPCAIARSALHMGTRLRVSSPGMRAAAETAPSSRGPTP